LLPGRSVSSGSECLNQCFGYLFIWLPLQLSQQTLLPLFDCRSFGQVSFGER
jgi:hypothetical protein